MQNGRRLLRRHFPPADRSNRQTERKSFSSYLPPSLGLPPDTVRPFLSRTWGGRLFPGGGFFSPEQRLIVGLPSPLVIRVPPLFFFEVFLSGFPLTWRLDHRSPLFFRPLFRQLGDGNLPPPLFRIVHFKRVSVLFSKGCCMAVGHPPLCCLRLAFPLFFPFRVKIRHAFSPGPYSYLLGLFRAASNESSGPPSLPSFSFVVSHLFSLFVRDNQLPKFSSSFLHTWTSIFPGSGSPPPPVSPRSFCLPFLPPSQGIREILFFFPDSIVHSPCLVRIRYPLLLSPPIKQVPRAPPLPFFPPPENEVQFILSRS